MYIYYCKLFVRTKKTCSTQEMAPSKDAAANNKKAKLYNSRTIKTQINDSSFVDKEKLKIPEFLQARRFEIKSFEISQLNSKYALANRVFQSLPRTLRRRAASHNVKKIPKRLRLKALREMKNTLNGVPPKAEHLRGRRLYRLKMSKRLLKLAGKLKLMRGLPKNDIYGNRLNLRARIAMLNKEIEEHSQNTNKIKLNNTMGSYDNTGVNMLASRPRGNMKFFKRQKHFVWLPTHVWHAKRFHMIKKHEFQIPYSPTQKCFRRSNRQSRFGTTLFDTSYYSSMIVQIDDAADFQKFLLSITKFKTTIPAKILNGSKTYNDWVLLDGKKQFKATIYSNVDCGKILITVFPSIYVDLFEALSEKVREMSVNYKVFDCRYSLGSLTVAGPTALNTISKVLHFSENESDDIWKAWTTLAHCNDAKLVPQGTTFSFNVHDPRFWKRPVNIPPKDKSCLINDIILQSHDNKTSFVRKSSIEQLLEASGRTNSYRNQMSTKQISQAFGATKDTSNSISSSQVSATSIPLLVYKLTENSWTIVLPWFWTLPFWIKLVSTRNSQVAGLKQMHQYNFENNIPTFPVDYSWTKEGWIYNETQGVLNEEKYSKLPSSMKNKDRPDYLDSSILSPFKCDWSTLRDVHFAKVMSGLLDKQLKESKPGFATFDEQSPDLSRIINSYHDVEQVVKTMQSRRLSEKIPIEIFDKTNEEHRRIIDNNIEIPDQSKIEAFKLPVNHVSLDLVADGVIKTGARIYSQIHEDGNWNKGTYNLIGFVTSGGFNLNVGHETGLGLVTATFPITEHVFIRNIGATSLYKAKIDKIT